MPPVVKLSDAKANLSALVREVGTTGRPIVITVRDQPIVTLSPYEDKEERKGKAFGALARYASAEARAQEDGAWVREVQERGER